MIRTYSNLDSTTEEYITEVIDCGFVVHKDVGPGYMEPLYSNALCVELRARGIPFEREKVITVKYRDEPVGTHRLDFVVRGCIVIELKAAKALEPVHQAQIMAYMKASKIRVGLLMNFCAATFKEGSTGFTFMVEISYPLQKPMLRVRVKAHLSGTFCAASLSN